MRGFSGVGLVVVGFLFLYMAVTGKLDCLFAFVSCVTGGAVNTTSNVSNSASGGGTGVTGLTYSNGQIGATGSLGGVPVTGSFNLPIMNFGNHGPTSI